ncbi:MAG: hypothetical protein M0Q27_01810 [Candidatus Colwellbacteria bacterium]|nr:hypothetical protein [Candidatus Colwellbacteria bacterium]
MSLKNPKFIKFYKELFHKNGENLDNLTKTLDEVDNKKLQEITHFYYFICSPEDKEVRDELIIIGITSIMEALMQDPKYIDIFSYFDSVYPKQNKIDDFKEFKRGYLNKYGATRKVKSYINTYLSETDKEDLISSVDVWDNKKKSFNTLKNINEFSDLLYRMRSEFVHEAKMEHLNLAGCSFSVTVVDKCVFKIKINIREFKKIFERSFVKYWLSKCK